MFSSGHRPVNALWNRLSADEAGDPQEVLADE
jgi:hypothetical protein